MLKDSMRFETMRVLEREKIAQGIEALSWGFEYGETFDLGNFDTPILRDPESGGRADVLFLESTYGDRLHEGRDERMFHFAAILDHCLSDGGKVFIPAFSLGRTQELLYELDRIFSSTECQNRFPRLASGARPPVFVDSPLGLEITRIYSSLREFWDDEAKARYYQGRC